MTRSRMGIVFALGVALVLLVCSNAYAQRAYVNQWWRMARYGYYDTYYFGSGAATNDPYAQLFGLTGTPQQTQQLGTGAAMGFTKAWGGGAASTGSGGFTPAYRVHSPSGSGTNTQTGAYAGLQTATTGANAGASTTTTLVGGGGSAWVPRSSTTITGGTSGVGLSTVRTASAASVTPARSRSKAPQEAAQAEAAGDAAEDDSGTVQKSTGSGVIVYKSSTKTASGGSSGGYSKFMEEYRGGESASTETASAAPAKSKATFFTKAASPRTSSKSKSSSEGGSSGGSGQSSSVQAAGQGGGPRMVRPNVGTGVPAGTRDFRSQRGR